MNERKFVWALVFGLILWSLNVLDTTSFAAASPDESFPQLAMPNEQVNYTIMAAADGSLWAKIDGNYPISVLSQQGSVFKGDLPMVYPMPPGATNIHVYLGDRELSWVNYNSTYPDSLHHTAIGDWGMIYCILNDVSDDFLLKIHYEHPLEKINSSYLFLYDLNISPYLSEQSNNSTCYYTIHMETNATNIQAYTTTTDTEWNPINYTTKQEGTTQVVFVQERSEYNKPLPGDFVFEFSNINQVPELSFGIIQVLVLITLAFFLIFLKKNEASLSKASINK
jgi:hypothetical protein